MKIDRSDVDSVRARLRDRAGKGPARSKAGREPVTSVTKVESDRSRKNSRVKGSRAELDVAAMFAKWCGETVRRTPLSGGWSTAKFGVTADLVCPNPAFPFGVEVKYREHWVLDDLVTGVRRDHDKSIVQWWRQCVGACPGGKQPLLVFRRNRQPWLVMLRADALPGEHHEIGVVRTCMPGALDAADVVVLRLDVFLDLEPVPRGLKNHGRKP